MRIRGLLLLVVMISALGLSITACTGDDDDDDDGFGATLVSIGITGATTVGVGSSLQLTATGTFDDTTTQNITTTSVWTTSNAGIATVGAATGLVTGVGAGTTTILATKSGISGSFGVTVFVGVPAPTPVAIAQVSSFVGATGDEIWLCFDHQFNGSISTLFTTDGATCEDTKSPGLTSVITTKTRSLVMFDGLAACAAGNHNWEFDYTDADDPRCPSGCVKEHDFTQSASGTFGTYCGPGTMPVTALSAVFAPTTGLPRFTATAGVAGETTISGFRVYTQNGAALLHECTASVTLTSGGTGAFDAACSPDLALVNATTYTTMMEGLVGGIKYAGRIDFTYDATP